MTETKTPSPTTRSPSPSPGVTSQSATSQGGRSPSGEFMAAVMDMSWQLAAVVLVPIVGGFYLDKVFATSPLLVILGFIIAMAGFTLIVRRQLQIFTPPAPQITRPEKKEPSR